jgi:hypothetical protein
LDPSTEFDDRVAWAKQRMEDLERERENLLQKTREDRKLGRLSSLVEKIKACTPQQLRRVITVARNNLKDYKNLPTLWDKPKN